MRLGLSPFVSRTPSASELFLVPAHGGEVHQLTHNQGLESNIHWMPSGNTLILTVSADAGSMEGPYQDVQGRIYSIDASTGKFARLGSAFQGSWENVTVTSDGAILAAGLTGIDQRIYRLNADKAELSANTPGNAASLDAARHSSELLFTHSTINDPTQVYVADSPAAATTAKPSPPSTQSSRPAPR